MADICIITSYFPPETGAASNRIFHLAHGLQEHGFNVSVITPLPNYPKGKVFEGYKGKIKLTSSEKNITVHRLWIYASNSKNKFVRLMAMLSYSLSLIWFFLWHKIPNKVIVQSPPLLVAFTCMLFLKRKKRKLILNVSDLWPIAGLELGAFKKNFSYRLLERIEHFNYKSAQLILGQSEEILTHITHIFPKKKTFLYRNYPNFKAPEIAVDTTAKTKTIKLVYAGLLGVAQGINKLCHNLNYKNIEFHIYGAGSETAQIKSFIDKNPELPIIYHGEVSRHELHKELFKFDVAIIPLLNRIYGSVPSKIFEYARLGLPMIYFGGGEGEKIIKKYHLGWVVEPGNYDGLNKTINSLIGKELPTKIITQKTALQVFSFNDQLKQLIKVI